MDSLLETNNVKPELATDIYWAVSIVTVKGDVYQMLGRLWDLQPAINTLRNAIIEDNSDLVDGSSIREIVIV